MFESKRELKRQIASLTADLLYANNSAESRSKEVFPLKAEIEDLKTRNETLSESCKKFMAEKKKLGALVRKQTEADILLNALEAVGIIKNDSEKQPDRTEQHEALMQQRNYAARMAGMQGAAPSGLGGRSMFDDLFGPGRW